LAGPRQAQLGTRFGSRQGQEPIVGRIPVGSAGIQDRPHPESAEQLGQAAHVILVRVGQDDGVDTAPPPRQRAAQSAQDHVGVGTSVDEHRPA
jgi:hypothetical protein